MAVAVTLCGEVCLGGGVFWVDWGWMVAGVVGVVVGLGCCLEWGFSVFSVTANDIGLSGVDKTRSPVWLL